jgi:AraC-like DNA-binding protein
LSESVKIGRNTSPAAIEPQRTERRSGKRLVAWEDALKDLFGPHSIERGADWLEPAIWHGTAGGLIRYWTIDLPAVRLIAGRRTVSGDALKTGTFLLLLIEDGGAEIELFNRSIKVGPGDAILLTAMEPLVLSVGQSFSASWIELPVWWLIELFGGGLAGARTRLDAALGSTEMLNLVFAQLCAPGAQDQIEDLIDMFGDVLRPCLMIADRSAEIDDGQIGRIVRFIGGHHGQEGLSPRDASRALGCSVSSIHKYCAAAGTSFGRMVMTARMSHAAYLLARDDTRIAEIAFDCGFASISHFCRTFKAIYGVAPGELRKRHVNKAEHRRTA